MHLFGQHVIWRYIFFTLKYHIAECKISYFEIVVLILRKCKIIDLIISMTVFLEVKCECKYLFLPKFYCLTHYKYIFSDF